MSIVLHSHHGEVVTFKQSFKSCTNGWQSKWKARGAVIHSCHTQGLFICPCNKKKKARSTQFSTPSIIQTYTLVSTIVLHTLLSSSCRLASHKAETLVKIDTYLLDLMQVRPTVGCAWVGFSDWLQILKHIAQGWELHTLRGKRKLNGAWRREGFQTRDMILVERRVWEFFRNVFLNIIFGGGEIKRFAVRSEPLSCIELQRERFGNVFA